MIAPTTTQRDKQQRLPLPRTRRRLAEAQAALDRGEPTVAVIIIRAAIETAAWEIVGPIEGRTFVRMICCSVAGKQRSKKIEGRYGNANKVVHGVHDASHREAKRMLWLIRIIGGRWVRRVFGVNALDGLAETMDATTKPAATYWSAMTHWKRKACAERAEAIGGEQFARDMARWLQSHEKPAQAAPEELTTV